MSNKTQTPNCPFCNKAWKYCSDINGHERKLLYGSEWECPKSPDHFYTTKRGLFTHIKTQHNIEPKTLEPLIDQLHSQRMALNEARKPLLRPDHPPDHPLFSQGPDGTSSVRAVSATNRDTARNLVNMRAESALAIADDEQYFPPAGLERARNDAADRLHLGVMTDTHFPRGFHYYNSNNEAGVGTTTSHVCKRRRVVATISNDDNARDDLADPSDFVNFETSSDDQK